MTDSSQTDPNQTNSNQAQQLWQSQPVEDIKMSADVIRRRAGKFERRIFWRNLREYVSSLVAAVLFAYFFATTHALLFRIAYALFIAGLGWVVLQLHRKGSARSMPAAMGSLTCLQFFRAELVRQRDIVSNVWPWYLAPLVPGFVVLTVGYAVARPAGLAAAGWLDAVVAVLFLLVWKMNQRAARCLQRMIDELSAAENQPQSGGM
ncbi:MAG TPA: hypothetical protein VKF84_00915 [Candidatus Sulfotelmatobacter sp.]|nr:hypothetical protein [Candidatus Sulfotelmatobacter sp.]